MRSHFLQRTGECGATLICSGASIGSASVSGFASLAILILFIGGIQLLTVGLLGEYISRIFDEAKQRPLYIMRSVVGWSQNPPTAYEAEESVHDAAQR